MIGLIIKDTMIKSEERCKQFKVGLKIDYVATTMDYYYPMAHCVRNHLVSRWIRTQ